MSMESDLIIPGVRVYSWHYRVHLAKYVFASGFVKGKEVLDVGCGVGYGSSYLLLKGAKRVIGVDASQEAIKLAKANFERTGLEFASSDATALPFKENTFDIVTCIGMIDHVDNPERVVSESWKTLRPGGYFLCGAINREFISWTWLNKPLDPMHKTEFTPAELSQLVGKYFSGIQLYGSTASKLFYRTWCSVNYIFNRVFGKSSAAHHITIALARVVFPDKYTPIIYSEDRVDMYFASGSEYLPITSNIQSRVAPFVVVGVKESP